jgi:hypothetical protein
MAKTTKESEVNSQETEEEAYLVYNMWIENLTINAESVILQTGQPTKPPPKPPGG